MTAPRSGRYALLRLAATLPAFIGLICAFSFTAKATEYRTAEPAGAVAPGDSCRVELRILAHNGPLAGAIVRIAGTERGTVSDREGKAAITAPQGATLEIGYVDFATATLRVAAQATMNAEIALQPEDPETVEVSPPCLPAGLGAARKLRDRPESRRRPPQGEERHAGLRSRRRRARNAPRTARHGARSALSRLRTRHRGGRNVVRHHVGPSPRRQRAEALRPLYARRIRRETDALYIIDGVERPSIEELNASQIASISVLKDESAVRLYGERARHGVILITTKWFDEQLQRKAGKSAAEAAAGSVPATDVVEAQPSAAGTTAEEEEAYIVPEQMPRFEGGDLLAFRQWVQQQIRYPEQAQETEGRVIVTFVIEKDGSVGTIRTLASPHRLLSDEVHRVLAASPRWTPGTQKGEPVRVKFTLPVDFRLQASATSDETAEARPATQTPAPAAAEAAAGRRMPRHKKGDLNDFRRWVQARLRYPAEAKAAKAQGRVVVRFTVERDGSVGDIATLRSPRPRPFGRGRTRHPELVRRVDAGQRRRRGRARLDRAAGALPHRRRHDPASGRGPHVAGRRRCRRDRRHDLRRLTAPAPTTALDLTIKRQAASTLSSVDAASIFHRPSRPAATERSARPASLPRVTPARAAP